MSLEDKLYDLIESIDKLTAAVQHATSIHGTAAAVTALAAAAKSEEEPRRGRGRPPGSKNKPEPVASADEFPADAIDPAPAPAPAPKPASAPAPAPKPVATSVDAPLLRSTLIEVVKKHGRDKCGELCRAHGGPNLSALDPSVYPAIYAEALELLAQDAE